MIKTKLVCVLIAFLIFPNLVYATQNVTAYFDAATLSSFTGGWRNGTQVLESIIWDDNLILAMSFNNNSAIGENSTHVADISRQGNNGTNWGAVWTSSGKYGGAYNFDTTTDKIELDNIYNLTGAFTFIFWGYKASYGNDGIFGNQLQYSVGRMSFTNANTINFHDSGSFPITFTAFPTNTWFHLTIRRDDSNHFKVFRNGVDVTTNDLVKSSQIQFNRVGDNPDASGWTAFNGKMDEVRVYNRALSADEIKLNYKTSLSKYNNTRWKFDMETNDNLCSHTFKGARIIDADWSNCEFNITPQNPKNVKIEVYYARIPHNILIGFGAGGFAFLVWFWRRRRGRR